MLKIGILPKFRGKVGRGTPPSKGDDPMATKSSQEPYFQMVKRNVRAIKMARMPWKKVESYDDKNKTGTQQNNATW